MSRPVLIGIGGHVVGALVEQLGAVPGLAGAVELHLAPVLPGNRPRAAQQVLARAAVVLAEAGALDPAARAALPAGCTAVVLPRLEFDSLWPLATEHPPRDGIPAVAAPFGDRIALRLLQDGTSPAARRAAYDAAPPPSTADLDILHEAAVRDLFRREAGCDIRVAAFVLSRFRQERLFHSPFHPAAPLLAFVFAQLLGHPALAALHAGSYDACLRAVLPGLDAVFSDCQAPIHPAVARHFDLAWWSPDLHYRQGEAVRSFGEWIDWHLREPPPPRRAPVGPDLAALHASGTLAQAAELHPAAAVARVAPFFATPIDPAIAPHGAALLRPDAGRYTAPTTLAALLPGATVLGDSGAVLHNGVLLADTVADNPLPPPASPPRHRIDAPALLAHGPGWAADPHGIATLLPRLVAAARLRRRQPELRILLPAAARAAWLEEMLALLGLAPAALWLPDEAVACAALTVADRLGLAEISPLARHAAQALASLVPVAAPGPRLLYLRSAQASERIRNEPLLAATLAARGFTSVDADHIPLPQRIALLRHAAAVVAPQGGPLAEMAFCPAGAAVLELLGPADPSPLFWSLASVCGLRYGYVVGGAAGAPAPGSPFEVPLPMLEQAAGALAAR